MSMKRCSLILIALISLQLVVGKKFELSGNNSASVFVEIGGDLFNYDFNKLLEFSLAVETGPREDYSGYKRAFNLKIDGILFNISDPSLPFLANNHTQVLKNLKKIDVSMQKVAFVGTGKDGNTTTISEMCPVGVSSDMNKFNKFNGYIIPIELSGNLPPKFKLTSDAELFDPTSTSSSTSRPFYSESAGTTQTTTKRPISDPEEEKNFITGSALLLVGIGILVLIVVLSSSLSSMSVSTSNMSFRRAMNRATTTNAKMTIIRRYVYDKKITGCIIKKLNKRLIAEEEAAAQKENAIQQVTEQQINSEHQVTSERPSDKEIIVEFQNTSGEDVKTEDTQRSSSIHRKTAKK